MPIIAVLALMYAVNNWNAYFDALLYLKSASLAPLQLVLRSILILNTINSGSMDAKALLERMQMADLLKYSLIVWAACRFADLSVCTKYFGQGMLIGSIKG